MQKILLSNKVKTYSFYAYAFASEKVIIWIFIDVRIAEK